MLKVMMLAVREKEGIRRGGGRGSFVRWGRGQCGRFSQITGLFSPRQASKTATSNVESMGRHRYKLCCYISSTYMYNIFTPTRPCRSPYSSHLLISTVVDQSPLSSSPSSSSSRFEISGPSLVSSYAPPPSAADEMTLSLSGPPTCALSSPMLSRHPSYWVHPRPTRQWAVVISMASIQAHLLYSVA